MASQGLKFHTKAQMRVTPLNTGHRVVSKQVSSTLIPEQEGDPGFDAVQVRFDAS